MKQNLFGKNVAELQDVLAPLGLPKFRAKQIAQWMYEKGATSFDEMTNLSKDLRARLSDAFEIFLATPKDILQSKDGKTSKYLLAFADGTAVESVLMRQPYGNSICISTQAGCAMGCAFCASTLHGRARDLTGGEMLAETVFIDQLLRKEGQKVDTMVLMGSGEPLMNYDNVSDHQQYNTILSEIQANNPNYLAVAKKKSNDSYVMPGSRETGASNYYTITRTSKSEEDMDNHLYFRMSHSSSSGIYGVTIISFEVYFTAEGTFAADVKPEEIGVARSVVTSPFTTSKIDIGKLTRQTKNGKTYFAYSYQNVRDLVGYTWLYQQDAVADGVPSDVAETKHIYPVKVDGNDLYAFGNDTYYIETPVQIHTQSGLESPVGYRIVGARFNYLWGTATEGGTQTKTNYYITKSSFECVLIQIDSSPYCLIYQISSFSISINHFLKSRSSCKEVKESSLFVHIACICFIKIQIFFIISASIY